MPQAIRVIDRAADLADVATPFIDGRFLKWNNITGKFETAQVSHAGLADLNGDHHNIYLRTDGTRAMTAQLTINIVPPHPAAIRVNQFSFPVADITPSGAFWTYPAEESYDVFRVVPRTGVLPTFTVQGTGQISWGDGSSAADVTLYRDTATRIRVGGHFCVDNTLTTGRIDSTATSAALSSLTPTLQAGGHAGFGAVQAPNTHTLVLYGYNYANHPILVVSAKGFESGPFGAWDASATARLTVLADGHVGINTTSPSSPLAVEWEATGHTQIVEFRNPNLAAGSSNWILVGKSDSVGEGATFGYLYGTTSAEQFAFMGVTGDPASVHGLGLLVRKGGKVLMGTKTAIGHLTVAKPTVGIYDSTTISGFFGNPTGGDNVYFIGGTINGCYADPANNAALWVNFRGYEGGTTRTRSFVVADGTGTSIAHFDGDTKAVGIGTQQPAAKLDVIDGCIRARDGSNILPTSGAGVEVMMTEGIGYITAWDRGTATGLPLNFYASEYVFNAAPVRCDSGFNVSGNAGFSGTIPAGRDIYVLGGIIVGHS